MDDLTEWKHARLQGRTAAALWGLQKVENHLARCDEQSSAWRIKYSGTRDQNQNNPFSPVRLSGSRPNTQHKPCRPAARLQPLLAPLMRS